MALSVEYEGGGAIRRPMSVTESPSVFAVRSGLITVQFIPRSVDLNSTFAPR